MLKKLIFILVFLILTTGVYAAGEDLSSYKSLTVDSVVSSPVDFHLTGESVIIDYIRINYSWIPVDDYRQELISLSSLPSSVNNGKNLFFDINTKGDFNLDVSFRAKLSSDPVKVHEKIPFPIQDLSSDLIEYTKSSDLIDINSDIRRQATTLASGEDDLYLVVFKIADWVNTNIDYNLSTLTSEASLPSSWVLENKQGVCDELSNLFVSMLRSLGIPARVVSGISYTNSELFNYNWGAHGWTEVYFPDYGWIPFDPTYNQLGYVDATHIKMGDKTDDDRFNTQFVWRGQGFDLVPQKQTISGDIVSRVSGDRNEIDLSVDFLRDKVDLGSYNVIIAHLKNNMDYYVTRVLDISRVKGVKLFDEARKDVVLKPGEEKDIFWIVKVEELDEGFIYTFPVSVYSNFEEALTPGFKASVNEEYISYDVASSYASGKESKVSKMDCVVEKDEIYINEKVNINCDIDRSFVPSRLNICFQGNCEYVDVNNGEFAIETVLKNSGFRTDVVTANGPSWKDKAFISMNVVNSPKLTIENITVPDKVKFDEKFNFDFILFRNGGTAKNVSVRIIGDLFDKEWKFGKLTSNQIFSLSLTGSDMTARNNNFKILVSYLDVNGRTYSTAKEVSVEIYDMNLWQRILLFFNKLEVLLR